jgi:transcriptional regulator with AAA-type ATPase domain/transcriptional regulatory protein LevR
MEDKLLDIIKHENPYNPYKDDQIAELLKTTRSNVVRMRKNLNVESYHIRRMPFLLEKIKELMLENKNISTVYLTQMLNEMSFDISRFLVAKIRDGILEKEKSEESDKEIDIEIDEKVQIEDSFISLSEDVEKNRGYLDKILRSRFGSYELVGESGSIKNSVKRMRAAFLYPPSGLNTIIVGETGTGKSKLVETVYNNLISKGEISSDRKLIKYNCANYANNPELLMSQLFGHLKGSFTGANSDKDGIIKEADGGILFLDEIHRLSSVGQEMLFTVIDEGKYRRLGQSSASEDIDVMIIGATTEDISSNILGTFKRRIPMIIELPSLENRGIDERFQIIVSLLQLESNKLEKLIMISSHCLVNLLTYNCKGNLGQLKSDIRVAIANSYLNFLESQKDFLELKMSDFPKTVHESITEKLTLSELDFYRDHGVLVKPDESRVTFIDERQIEVKPEQLCNLIDSVYESFEKQSLPTSLVSDLIFREIKYRISHIIKKESYYSEKSAVEYVKRSSKYEKRINGLIEYVEEELGELRSDVKGYMRISLEDFFLKIDSGWDFPDVTLTRAEEEFLLEYRIALEALNEAFQSQNYCFPKIIIGIISTYIHFGYTDCNKKGDVKVVIIAHGKIATAMAEVCNYYVHEKVLSAIDMPLELSKEEYIDYVLKTVSEYEENNLLLLVDLGTPLLLGEIISRKTDKYAKTVARVDLALALEAAIKVKKKNITLTEIYDYLKNKQVGESKEVIGNVSEAENIIIVTCVTGQGASNNIKAFLKKNFKGYLDGVDILPFGVMTHEILQYIERISKTQNLIACIGTYAINLENVPFFEMSELIQDSGKEKLIRLLGKTETKSIDIPLLSDYIFDDAIFFDRMYINKAEAIGDTSTALNKLGYVTEEYKYNVLKREAFISTDYKYGVSIPHTGVDYVRKSVISITRFSKPIMWTDTYECSIMLMLALRKEDVKVIRALRKMIENEEFIERINNRDKEGIIELIRSQII